MDTPSCTLIANTFHSTLSKIQFNNAPAVIKVYRRRDARAISQFTTEVSILQELQSITPTPHPNIITLLASSIDDLTITLAYAPGQTLDNLIDPATQKCILSPSDAAKIQLQMANAISFVHGNRIIHDDVKPDNIIYDKDTQNAVLVDFGAAFRVPEDGVVLFNLSGTPPYAPPEYLQRRKGMGGDVWALGVTMLFVMGYIKLPDGEWILPMTFEDAKVKEEMETWLAEVESWRRKAGNGEIDTLLGEILEGDPDRRIGSQELSRLLSERSRG
ncbi:hypothetical protein TWF696_009018 [Orbilia brochopaga]|uniref:Protein kinase domain-containing protein n=1 Tax=Orbilia brochopaga TaxID=3140254 RepID=A0AAV9UIE2_9PEZI